jgi:hypothetical protein
VLLHLLQVNGAVEYNGKGFDEFVVERTAAYVDQVSNPASKLGSSRHNRACWHTWVSRCCPAQHTLLTTAVAWIGSCVGHAHTITPTRDEYF